MKKIAALTLLLTLLIHGAAFAEAFTMVGAISKIDMAADKKSATVVLKDTKTDADVTIVINDELTLDKFNDKRIVDGDEIRCKYDNESGKNISKRFQKTAGC